jgi:hypothetical protein
LHWASVLETGSACWSTFFLGAAIANLVRVPLYPRNARESHVHMLAHTGCRAVVVSEKYAPEIKSKGVAGRDRFYLYPPVEPGESCLHLAPINHGSGYLFTPISDETALKATRSSETPCIRAMARPRYYLLR